jgi:hypothetical protein
MVLSYAQRRVTTNQKTPPSAITLYFFSSSFFLYLFSSFSGKSGKRIKYIIRIRSYNYRAIYRTLKITGRSRAAGGGRACSGAVGIAPACDLYALLLRW